ncbi:MAG: hypothetical protein NTX70_00245 [Verrucomicrobia bacterium]|nr:hypothetical protein [Verrucomicrobiota bacterium]
MHLGYRPSRESENQQSVWRRSLLSEFRFIIAIAGVLLGIPVGWTATNRFDALTPPAPDGNLWIRGSGRTNAVYRIERSSNLADWTDWRRLIPPAGVFQIADSSSQNDPAWFYRFRTTALTAADDWKNQIQVPSDVFSTTSDQSQVRWIKFLILTDDPTRVYFQDGNQQVLHYEFAKARLPRFAGLSRAAFDAISLRTNQQQVVLGAILFPPDPKIPEWGIQFAGLDAYPTEWVSRYFRAVCHAVDAAPGQRVLYFPTFEQADSAQASGSALVSQGIPLGSVFRWIHGDQVYSSGWAVGRLNFIPGTQIAQAYNEGQLRPSDILLTDGVPAEIPYVAGIVSLIPATSNSHVALYAGANSLPFAYVADTNLQQRFRQLNGREIVLRAGIRYGYQQVSVADIQGQLNDSTRRLLSDLKSPPPVNLQSKATLGSFSAVTTTLMPAHRKHFGGKAVHYGLLRRTIPNNSEPAIAFSFDLWESYMDQSIPGEGSLRQAISQRLSGFTNFPPDINALRIQLAAIRGLITGTAAFSPGLRSAVTNALSGFDPVRKIRFRSSSNAEDSASFVAAGLYDSFSGCLLDDLDGNSTGPCGCDATETQERGVFRAIQKVYASFYNDNAFLERLRHRIDESQVAMAVLVHYSTPDELEMANGVAQVAYQAARWGPAILTGDLVTQLGAVSVTNPDGGAVPESVRVNDSWADSPSQRCSLVPLGSTVLNFPSDYTQLFGLMQKVHLAYGNPGALLDFEYKKVRPGKLLIKQVRELPQPVSAPVEPFLVNEPSTYWAFNSEHSGIMADHRLKCFLQLGTRNIRLSGTNLNTCFYSEARFEYRLQGTVVETLSGSPSNWPSAKHEVIQNSPSTRTFRDSWTIGSGSLRRRYTLITEVPMVDPTEGLVVTSRDLKKWLEVTYDTPSPNPEGTPTTTEAVRLVLAPDPAKLALSPAETFQAGKLGVSIAFLVSSEPNPGPPLTIDPNPYGAFPAYYPSWAHATLTGLLPEPLVLTAYHATTASVGHQRRFQWFLFEPGADPSLSASQRQALETANVQRIYIYREPYSSLTSVRIQGNDGGWSNP